MVLTKNKHTEAKKMLENAQNYADLNSTCVKVKVGSLIITPEDNVIFGCNHGIHNCKTNGCRRIKLYGENSKEHRLPSDCDAVHSEIDAISKAAQLGVKLKGASIFVTRYPCEACARAIAGSGIKYLIYGRKGAISEYTDKILTDAGVEYLKIPTDVWDKEDNNA